MHQCIECGGQQREPKATTEAQWIIEMSAKAIRAAICTGIKISSLGIMRQNCNWSYQQ